MTTNNQGVGTRELALMILLEIERGEKILCRRLLLQMSDNLFQEKEFRDMPCKNPFKE